ncbi:MAG: hypothetical protein AAGP08_19525, partial [Pseudomonadota bacterium]
MDVLLSQTMQHVLAETTRLTLALEVIAITTTDDIPSSSDAHKHGVLFVFSAGILWSRVGLGIRLIEEAVVWQILLYRSMAISLFLYVVIRFR